MGVYLSKLWAPKHIDIPDLTGKVILVTGGNTGIGYYAIQQLAKHNAKVYMGARDESKAMTAISQLEFEGIPKGRVSWLKVDLGTIRQAKLGAEEFLRREKRLDILVNNAGMMSGPFKLNTDGISTMMATNYVGPFVFTNTLLPLLQRTAHETNSDVRIINLTSHAHDRVPSKPKILFDSLESFNISYEGTILPDYKRYALSKLASILYTRELQRRVDADGIRVIAIHPGTIVTEGMVGMVPFQRLTMWIVRILFMSPQQGATVTLITATSPNVKKDDRWKGAFVYPFGRIVEPSPEAKNIELGEELWSTTEKIVKDTLIRDRIENEI